MKAQFKYAFLQEITLRAAALAAVLLLNLVFGILGYIGVLSNGLMITAVTFSSLALCGVFTVNIIADIGSIKSLFGTPEGYLSALTPVKGWKILLARTVSIICQDFISLFIGIFGVVWQSFVLSGLIGWGIDYSDYTGGNIPDIICGFLILLLGYAYIIMFIVFSAALKNSIFFGVPGRSWLSLASVAAVAWVFNLLNFVLAPFGEVGNWRMFYYIGIPYGFNAGTVAWFLIASARIAALFIASSILLERKNNL